ncbi:TetR/AcrR family transcriptional regulator C-terminal domain-containing protein [Microbacterium yannicii]|uniref:TetR/AcrR family transcriptional regulator C-terminal domain-containing protein n=1 Tax=Microbacterium yannicii TaxID=671622 RepID=A0ABP9M9U6_9MICO|nr:TetR/AcrR family transcriptional regulator C-terminal domain-containing protein [Microbacterium yannicii]MCO5951488.1 TetR/AcrR family transcriptional regulator C-terminal domain-containing protein [Microbacterium yannicii]
MKAESKQDGLRTRRVDSDDARVVKTRERLVRAYRQILDEDPRHPVTVTEVVRRAGVTRSSFYAHFAGADDLAAVALTEFNAAVVALARSEVREGLPKSEVNRRVIAEIAAFVAERRDTYGALLARGDDFARSVTAAFAEQALVTLRTRETLHADPEITARYMGAGLIGVLSWWLDNDDDRSPEELAQALIAIAPPDFVD